MGDGFVMDPKSSHLAGPSWIPLRMNVSVSELNVKNEYSLISLFSLPFIFNGNSLSDNTSQESYGLVFPFISMAVA